MAPVVVIDGPGRTPLHIVLSEPLEIGRACPGVLVDDPAVSRRHVELRPDGDVVYARDLDSANGTTIEGRPVNDSTVLALGAVLRLGDVTVRLVGDDHVPIEPSTDEQSTTTPLTSIERVADAVARRGSPALDSLHGATRTIVFSDIEDSTAHAVRLGDVEWFRLLEEHNRVVRAGLEYHDGTEVKAQGDGFMLTFPSARRAVAYMVSMQRAVAVSPMLAEQGLGVRVGAHTGEAVEADDGDLFGQAVIAAARVGAAARGGEILVSSLVREIVESWGEFEFGASREVELKGLSRPWTLHAVDWRPSAEEMR